MVRLRALVPHEANSSVEADTAIGRVLVSLTWL